MSGFLNLIYLLVVILASPLLVYRALVHGKYREGWSQKFFGRLPERTSDATTIWLHAVSVGEVLLLQPVLKELAARPGRRHIVISTTTQTGQAVAREKFPGCEIVYFPLDFTWAVNRALDRVRPDLIVLVELELWPNFIFAANRRRIPLVLINGRLSEKSHRGYSRVRPLVGRLLRCFEQIAVQSETYAGRFRQLGAPPERVRVTGSVKFDQAHSDRRNPQTLALRTDFGLRDDAFVFIAGSTQAPEESFALEAYRALKTAFPQLRLVLVPRHQERFEEVAAVVQSTGLPLWRRSAKVPAATTPTTTDPVLLLDTLGELGACWGLADFAFVGGSLTRRGGQNMIEPAAYGAAVVFGPNTWNFRDVVQLLLSHDAAAVVRSAAELTASLRSCLNHPEQAREQGKRARGLVLAQQGATRRTLEIVLAALPGEGTPSKANSRAA